jgi:DNA gyrase subunit A
VEKLKSLLYKKTKLEDTFGVNMLAIVDGRPETLGLKAIIRHHIDFQYQLAQRKYTTLLAREKDNKEIQEGLIKACDIIDLIIEILRGCKNRSQAKDCLMTGNVEGIRFRSPESEKQARELSFTERQANAILELRLYRLIGLELLALQKQYEETLEKIAEYEKILGSRTAMKNVIKKDLQKIKKEYALPRKTEILDAESYVYVEEQVKEAEVAFLMDRFGYAKTIDMAAYERNMDAVHSENRYVFKCMNTDKICIFTDNGNLHQIKVMDIPFTRFRDKGVPIDNLGNYDSSGENIVYLCPGAAIVGHKLLFVTRQGMMKLVDASEFEAQKRTVAATKLNEGDTIISIEKTDARVEVYSRFSYDGEVVEDQVIESSQNVVVQTENGVFLKFPLGDVPEKKKGAVGVRGIKLAKDDQVSEVYIMPQDADVVIEYHGRSVDLGRMKLAHRDTKGIKVRA